MPDSLPRVVIVGGGFGGLYSARALAGAPVSVTLIDKRNYHLFRPMLYQVATGLLSADQISGPLRSILVRKKEGILTFRKVAAPAEGCMGVQHLGKLWSNRDQTAFIELRAAYGQNGFRQIDIRQRETRRLTEAQSGPV